MKLRASYYLVNVGATEVISKPTETTEHLRNAGVDLHKHDFSFYYITPEWTAYQIVKRDAGGRVVRDTVVIAGRASIAELGHFYSALLRDLEREYVQYGPTFSIQTAQSNPHLERTASYCHCSDWNMGVADAIEYARMERQQLVTLLMLISSRVRLYYQPTS